MRCAGELDFTSALYLGLWHSSASLQPWQQLTAGRPAALAVPVLQRQVARALAQLVGCERAVLAPSTLHLFWDLFGLLSRTETAIYMDSGLYPIGRWGVERAACRGMPVRRFQHYQAASLRQQLWSDIDTSRRPIVVADGFCPGCGRPAPLHELLELIRPLNGLLIVDDTQALGVWGHMPSRTTPYGQAGGGSLRLQAVQSPHVVLISSLAKGFGVPAAMLAGHSALVEAFETRSETRTHCSPPSMAAIQSAAQAMAVNRDHGDALRLRLARRVMRIRTGMARAGYSTQQSIFPVQTLMPRTTLDAVMLHALLLRRGVRTVLHQAGDGTEARLSFLITARHTSDDIDEAVQTLAQVSRVNRVAKSKRTVEVTHGAAITGRSRSL